MPTALRGMLASVAIVISQLWSFSRIVPSNPIVPCGSHSKYVALGHMCITDLNGLGEDVPRLGQEEGRHRLLIGQGGLQDIQRLLQWSYISINTSSALVHLGEDVMYDAFKRGLGQVQHHRRIVQQGVHIHIAPNFTCKIFKSEKWTAQIVVVLT